VPELKTKIRHSVGKAYEGEFSVGLYQLLESKRQQLEGSLDGEYLPPRIYTPFTRALKSARCTTSHSPTPTRSPAGGQPGSQPLARSGDPSQLPDASVARGSLG
jgi:hypothetical protein